MGKGRNAGEGAAGLSKSSAQNGAKKSAVKEAKPKDVTPPLPADLRFQRFSFRVSAFPLSPIRRWFR